MKIRTPEGRCMICKDNGEPIITSYGPTTYHAIKRLRVLCDTLLEEREKMALDNAEKPLESRS